MLCKVKGGTPRTSAAGQFIKQNFTNYQNHEIQPIIFCGLQPYKNDKFNIPEINQMVRMPLHRPNGFLLKKNTETDAICIMLYQPHWPGGFRFLCVFPERI
jgi:hypothetical protein